MNYRIASATALLALLGTVLGPEEWGPTWHFWFVEEIFAVPNHWMFNMGVVVAFMGALAYVVRVYARLVELGAETPAKNPYVAEMYKLALEGKLYSRSIP